MPKTSNNGYRLIQEEGETGIKCLDCGQESFLKNDISQLRCGYCDKQHVGEAKNVLDIKAVELQKKEHLTIDQIAKRLGISRSAAGRHVVAGGEREVEIIYPGYKEPMWQIEDGFGYYGAMGHSSDGKTVQCHECGKMFGNLSQHIKLHSLSSKEYKDKYKLSSKTSLTSHLTRKIFASTYQYLWSEEHKDYLRKQRKKRLKKGFVKGKQGFLSLEMKNRRGICPDQIIDKIQRLSQEILHAPSYTEFEKKYGYSAMDAAFREHGSYTNAVRIAGLTPASESATYDRIHMLEMLNDFRIRKGREALTSDLDNSEHMPRASTYHRAFGSLKEARREARKLRSKNREISRLPDIDD